MFKPLRKLKATRRYDPHNVRRVTLYEELVYHAEKFAFTKALDVASCICGRKNILIKSNINFTSKFTDVSKVEGLKDGIAEIHTNIAGIAGIEGILPDCYTENYVTFNRDSKKAVIDFFDIFNDRILSLRYAYQKKQCIESLSVPIESSVIGNIIFSLSGFEFDEKLNGEQRKIIELRAIPEQFKISAQNLFWKNTRSSSGLRAILQGFFKVPVNIKQFYGNFISVSPDERTIVGKAGNYNKLGKNSILGGKLWDATHGIRVEIGPLSFEQYKKFLPKKSLRDQRYSPLQKMKEIIKSYVPHGIDVSLHFFLDHCLVKGTTLTRTNQLNKDSFILGMHNSGTISFTEKV